jgi:hypothetical protein
MKRFALALAAGLVTTLVTSSVASAQAAGFTLFGTPSAEGQAVPAERQAVSPISDPYYHEDSFVTTDVRAWFLYHSFADNIALNGGDAEVYAVELRLALTDRLQLVANKDGYTNLDSGLIKNSGWNDIAAGLKYAVVQDWKDDFHVAVGAGYQFAFGDASVLQNEQEARFWASVNKGFGPVHLGATGNVFIPTGSEGALGMSQRISLHAHADYYLCKWFSPVLELNYYKSIGDGNNAPLSFSGADVTNLGGGADLLTGAAGFEVRPLGTPEFGIRAAYETDLGTTDSIYGYRWTLSAIYRF